MRQFDGRLRGRGASVRRCAEPHSFRGGSGPPGGGGGDRKRQPDVSTGRAVRPSRRGSAGGLLGQTAAARSAGDRYTARRRGGDAQVSARRIFVAAESDLLHADGGAAPGDEETR